MTQWTVSVEAVVGRLADNPGRIDLLMSAAPREARRRRPTKDAWSALETFAHVRACADVWGGHIRSIVEAGPSSLRAGDPRAWAADHGYAAADFAEAFPTYRRDRAELLTTLRSLGEEDWARSALMVGASSRVERSVLWHADHIARHEDQHVIQIRRTLVAGSGAGESRRRRR
ncbi:MAG TPA: DinB family protein [Candidatus Limnocylindrales bacterium]|nr:DinB family protein [Candidatus Limnocylindrales bacterium]